MRERDMRHIGVQLLRQDHRNRGVDSLPHLDLRHHQRGAAIGIDADEGIRREPALGPIGRLHRLVGGPQRQMECEQHTTGEAAGEQAAARDVGQLINKKLHRAHLTTDARRPPA